MVKLKRSHAYTPTQVRFTSQLVLKIMAPPTFAVDHTRTAKCPELLCLSQALLMPGQCPAPPRRALPLLHRSYELMRRTSLLLRTSYFPTYFPRSLQVAASPCWQLVLPDVSPPDVVFPYLFPEVFAGCCEPLLATGSSRRYSASLSQDA
jgi:hypothetical protein